MRTILVGYDGSDAALAALDFAVDLARRYQADVHVLAVAHLPEVVDDVETEAFVERARPATDELLAPIPDRYPDIAIRVHSETGHPAEQILRFAEAHGVDHIVLGHRGRSVFERWLLGSVSRRVVAYAPCTVTVTRPAASI